MTKEYSDRELVEYLDESVVWHEIVFPEMYGRKGSIFDMESPHDTISCTCGWAGGFLDHEGHMRREIGGEENPTPTLEWMLEKLRYHKKVKKVAFSKQTANVYCQISLTEKLFKGCEYVPYVARDEILALRGAICMLIESEEK